MDLRIEIGGVKCRSEVCHKRGDANEVGGDDVSGIAHNVVGVVELVVVNCFNMRAEMGKGPLGARK